MKPSCVAVGALTRSHVPGDGRARARRPIHPRAAAHDHPEPLVALTLADALECHGHIVKYVRVGPARVGGANEAGDHVRSLAQLRRALAVPENLD